METSATYQSFAKINLYLGVLNRRRDGYHNIETVFQSVSLADRLEFVERPEGVTLECSTPGLDCGDANLVLKAAHLLQDVSGCAKGAHVCLHKRIPIAAGLAGGSGNAAATLVALNELWRLRLSTPRLNALASSLGADVPYCLAGGALAGALRGEALSPLPEIPPAWFVLLHPPLAVSTPAVYGSPRLRRSDERPFAGRTASFRKAIRALAAGDFARGVYNAMEGAVFPDHPELAEAKARLMEAGCVAAAMSGSGPTLFGVCRSRRHAGQVARTCREYPTSIVEPTRKAVTPGSA